MIEYAEDMGLELTRYRSCGRCGINMQIAVWSLRRQCDDCVEYDVFEWGRFDWMFAS